MLGVGKTYVYLATTSIKSEFFCVSSKGDTHRRKREFFLLSISASSRLGRAMEKNLRRDIFRNEWEEPNGRGKEETTLLMSIPEKTEVGHTLEEQVKS